MSAIGSQVLNLLLTVMTALALVAATLFPQRAADPQSPAPHQLASAAPARPAQVAQNLRGDRPAIRFDEAASGSSRAPAAPSRSGGSAPVAAGPRQQARRAAASSAAQPSGRAAPVANAAREENAQNAPVSVAKPRHKFAQRRDHTVRQAAASSAAQPSGRAAPVANAAREESAQNAPASVQKPRYKFAQRHDHTVRQMGRQSAATKPAKAGGRTRNNEARSIASAVPDRHRSQLAYAPARTPPFTDEGHGGARPPHAPPRTPPFNNEGDGGPGPTYALRHTSSEAFDGDGPTYREAVGPGRWPYARAWRRQGSWSDRGYPPRPPGEVVTAYSRYRYRVLPPPPPFTRDRGRRFGPPGYPPPWDGYSGR